MKSIKKVSIVFFSLMLSSTVFAQSRVIHGVVRTLDSIPLIGVEVKVKSTKQMFYSDSLGNFTAMCNANDKLKVSAQGFYPENIKLPSKAKVVAINMRLKPGEKQRQYAIGYGYVSEEDRTTSVSNLNYKDTDFTRYNTVYELIQGKFPGVDVRNGEIQIRGNQSFNSSNAALVVVDGIVVDSGYLSQLKPIEIKSVDVIKDGSSAVYGSRGANGVVLIETKKGGE